MIRKTFLISAILREHSHFLAKWEAKSDRYRASNRVGPPGGMPGGQRHDIYGALVYLPDAGGT
jgi:hypothetical protein